MADTAKQVCKSPSERIRILSDCGSMIEIDSNVPPKRYFRSGIEMERMANVYLDERNYESAFILFTKFIVLFVEKLPSHVEYNKASAQDKAANKKRLKLIFEAAEQIKRILTKRYEEEYKAWQELEKKRKAEEELKRKQEEARKEEERKKADAALVEELEKREKNKGQGIDLPIPPINSDVTPSAPPLQSTLIGDFPAPPTIGSVDEISSIKNDSRSSLRDHGTPSSDTPLQHNVQTPSLYSLNISTPTVDRTSKPSDTTFTVDSGLRSMHIPTGLVQIFLDIASPNTRQNKETCGILTGKLKHNKFHITHLIIPKQSSTSDSCTTLSEEDLFEYQDSHDLITLGWIHTHPSQTAFMSSVDLHTHCSYQLMMPEAIAIVCSPKFNETGVFSLTQGYGMKFISSCRKPGFHPHPKEPPLYQESDHINWQDGTGVELVDLRR